MNCGNMSGIRRQELHDSQDKRLQVKINKRKKQATINVKNAKAQIRKKRRKSVVIFRKSVAHKFEMIKCENYARES